MLVADTYLGHRDDAEIAARLADSDPERTVLSDTDRRRSRVRTETESGRDLGIVVGRDLEDGAVLETEDGTPVVVELAGVEALVLEFGSADVAALTALELGHALGNRHWDLAVRETAALFPVTDSRDRMLETVADLLPEGVTTRFETVPPTTFDDASPDHSHDGVAVDHGHLHSHEHGHTADHDHAAGHEHTENHQHTDDNEHTGNRGVRTVEEDDA
jgi:urease accessory protein